MITRHLRAGLTAILLGFIGCNGGEPTGPKDEVRFSKLSAGVAFTCALDGEGTAYCWGRNDRGQLGDGSFASQREPVKVATDVKFATIVSSNDHTCGLTPNGEAYCWGDNAARKADLVSSTTIGIPTAVQTQLRFISIAPSARSTCATTAELEVYCWGRIALTNHFGDALTYTGPQPLSIGTGMVAVVAGIDGGYCSVDQAGLAYCWDLLFTYPPSGPAIPPIGQAVSTSIQFATLRRGYNHYCGVLKTGAVDCWGTNAAGQVGIGTITNTVAAPTPVNSNVGYSAVAAGGTGESAAHSCGLVQDGTLYCWGANDVGQLGSGTPGKVAIPTLVTGNLKFTTVRAGGSHTCAIADNGHTYCWGDNIDGALGTGAAESASTPKRVSGT